MSCKTKQTAVRVFARIPERGAAHDTAPPQVNSSADTSNP